MAKVIVIDPKAREVREEDAPVPPGILPKVYEIIGTDGLDHTNAFGPVFGVRLLGCFVYEWGLLDDNVVHGFELDGYAGMLFGTAVVYREEESIEQPPIDHGLDLDAVRAKSRWIKKRSDSGAPPRQWPEIEPNTD